MMATTTIERESVDRGIGRRGFIAQGLCGLGAVSGLPGLLPEASGETKTGADTRGGGLPTKITDLRVDVYDADLRDEDEASWKTWTQNRTGKLPRNLAESARQLPVLRVRTDAGIEGICHVRNMQSAHELVQTIKPLVMGRDPLDREFIWQMLWKMERVYHFSIWAHSAVDVALWDIAAKAAGMPLYKYLGAFRDDVPMYRSSALLMTPEAFVEEAVQAKAAGYYGYKLHPAGDVVADIASCRAVREAVGDGYNLMLDPFGAYNHEGAVRVGREIERLGYLWFEEPMSEWDIQGYAELARTLDIPICGPEVAPGSVYLTADFIAQRAVDIVRSDVALKGGITGLMKTARLAEAFGMDIEIHITFSPIMNAAQAHVACALANAGPLERLGSDEMNRQWNTAYGIKPDDYWVRIDDKGNVTPPSVPGIGVELDRTLLGDPSRVLS
jgi:L-alanine-DL-glutamate epimerase-like enolase superfamily enzyme